MNAFVDAYNVLNSIYNGFVMSPYLIVNQLLQAFFFSLSVSYFISTLLKIVKFAYADQVASMKTVHFMGVLLLYYLKIWDYQTGVLYFLSLFSMILVSVYVYDCCGNISQKLNSWRQSHRDVALIGSFAVMVGFTFWVYWITHRIENPLPYDYLGIYILLIMFIMIGNYFRRRSIIYTLNGVTTMNYLIACRYWLGNYGQQNNLSNIFLPLAIVPYFMMALDAQKREKDAIKNELISSIFRTCICLAAFSLLNNTMFALELALGGVFCFGIIINR